MQKITDKEVKQLLYRLLQEFDKLCRKNNIKYSLIGGSLIGAVREKGIIPWDDDVDVIMTPKNYKKLINLNRQFNSERYALKIPGQDPKYPFLFSKFIDTYTILKEKCMAESYEQYGVYLDIFTYCYTGNNHLQQKMHYDIIRKTMHFGTKSNPNDTKKSKKIPRILKNSLITIIGTKNIQHFFNYQITKYKNSKFYISNWPIYGWKHEVQPKAIIEAGYIDIQFGNINTMIFKNYDQILRTIFGDYMTPPPKQKRVSRHDSQAYWREGYEAGSKQN